MGHGAFDCSVPQGVFENCFPSAVRSTLCFRLPEFTLCLKCLGPEAVQPLQKVVNRDLITEILLEDLINLGFVGGICFIHHAGIYKVIIVIFRIGEIGLVFIALKVL